MPSSDLIDQTTIDQAIEWLVLLRFDKPCPQTEQAFIGWVSLHPHHAMAWQRVQAMSDEFAELPPEISRRALERTNRSPISRRSTLKLLSALGVVCTASWLVRGDPPVAEYLADERTAVGERREFETEDGSHILLNTRSAVDVDFDTRRRLLTLVTGEVAITDGADANRLATRPFWLKTRGGFLNAQSARLLVRERGDGTLVSVKSGEVRLFSAIDSHGPPARILGLGETVLIDPLGLTQAVVNVGDPWAWSEGVLSVQRMPLGEFIEDLSRYRSGFLRCSNDVAKLTVSGTFQLADTEAILALIAKTLPIRVDYRTRYWVTVNAA
jgi:transmembrane sensor